jgi:hypothetical protein
VVWLVAPESATQSVMSVGEQKPSRDCGSHSPNHSVEGGDCCGGGRVNKGPTCCTGRPYRGAVMKACDVNQYGALPMDGVTEPPQK